MDTSFVLLYGPTGVGKTALADELCRHLPCEIINIDTGQMYTALSKGTAKPDWKNAAVPHHLFDILDDPVNFTAYRFRQLCLKKIKEIRSRNNIPLIVGGSGFYVRSLFFAPYEHKEEIKESSIISQKVDFNSSGTFLEDFSENSKDVIAQTPYPLEYEQNRHNFPEESPLKHSGREEGGSLQALTLWQKLAAIDPERARVLHPHDTYRIERALQLWRTTGKLPSSLKPEFAPVGKGMIIFVDRDPEDLKARIDERVVHMLRDGWVEETLNLGSDWHAFLPKKGLMGYDDIVDASKTLSSAQSIGAYVKEPIQSKTRTYARRQRIFWRGFKKICDEYSVPYHEANLTLLEHDLYIKQLSESIIKHFGSSGR